MARLARVVVPRVPHHVTQRGNRRQRTFFGDEDYRHYLALLKTWSARAGTRIWAYCLMPNHVHVVAIPEAEDGLARTIGEVHRRYTRHVNLREGWRGHLWQARFASFPMDDAHLVRCIRYVELNPVRAGLCASPFDWRWSSAREHRDRNPGRGGAEGASGGGRSAEADVREGASGGPDGEIRDPSPLSSVLTDWTAFLGAEDGAAAPHGDGAWAFADDARRIRGHERTGRPLGSEAFVRDLEARLDRPLESKRPGPKRKG